MRGYLAGVFRRCVFVLRGNEQMGKTRKSFYAVRVGRNVGVYDTWAECEAQVKRYPGAVYKGFTTQSEARDYVGSSSSSVREKYQGDFYSRPHSGGRGTRYSSSYPHASSSSSSYSRSSYSSNPHSSYIPVSFYSGIPCSNDPSHNDDDAHCSSASSAIVYSDGCCVNNGRRDAQAGIGVYWGRSSQYNVSERLTGLQTNQRAELVSACRALETALDKGLRSVEVKTDSSYTIKAVTEWAPKWEANGWRTTQDSEVKNKEDIVRLLGLCQRISVKWTHVPGHCGIAGNEAADRLAKAGAQK